MKRYCNKAICIVVFFMIGLGGWSVISGQDQAKLRWEALPDFPNPLGVAGPFVGVQGDVLIVAGGANFPQPVWDNDKEWRDEIYVLQMIDGKPVWKDAGRLERPVAYGACVSTPEGVVCLGGNDGQQTFDDAFLMAWDVTSQGVSITQLPSLPSQCAFGGATVIGNTIYLVGGQSGNELSTAMANFWSLDLTGRNKNEDWSWQELDHFDDPPRALNLVVAQHNGFEECVYVMSGRRQRSEASDDVEFLTDVWEFSPSQKKWRERNSAPQCVMAGAGIATGQSHIAVLGGDDGALFFKGNELRDQHPGFPKKSWLYHTITDTWIEAGETPQNQVTTNAVRWRGDIVLPTGEVRPRVRTDKVWKVTPVVAVQSFGVINYIVLFGYLASMVLVGVWFAKRNRNTDDYFRGGSHIPWWVAGCSIFATMLSSLTYIGIPSKAFAQDWVYSIGNFMIPIVAVVAVYVAMPFFRRIDATSAYEYLEHRFDRTLRLFGSLLFVLFHIFRMAVVMSLTGLALAVATPLTPLQSVVLMGVLSIAYCTWGGIEAVVWTDTIQTFVLMGGAVIAVVFLVGGLDGGFTELFSRAHASDKMQLVNSGWSWESSRMALWIVLLGSIGQNLSSYTSDQAVVQRYMTTATQGKAAKAIWTNAILSIPATILFFGIGTALFVYYQSHPERLDPTINADQVFPLFISRELPVGIAGLIVAGIFAAAQSTVSTSMNSTATSLVTDFMRPFSFFRSEERYFTAAKATTFITGVLGTILALLFIDPEIKSLFDVFIAVIGIFMGVLCGLFMLGACTERANAFGAKVGASCSCVTMFLIWKFNLANSYLFSFIGIATCFVLGYLASFMVGKSPKNLNGLNIFSLRQVNNDRS
ncbi:MAG: sodium/solute symporter [Pirellulaceae bacterium]